MPLNNHFQIIGFHSCDKDIGIGIIKGEIPLNLSTNSWDWLGKGIYFWELNPSMALDYAIRSAEREQFNKIPINTPFVIGAIIELGECLNLTQMDALPILKSAYEEVELLFKNNSKPIPKNDDNNRKLDCAVFNHIHKSRADNNLPSYDTIRCAFEEGGPIYPDCKISSKSHIQISVLNPDKITGYFLPRPIKKYNPYFSNPFKKTGTTTKTHWLK